MQQSTILTAIRGCDTGGQEAKDFSKAIRNSVLKPALYTKWLTCDPKAKFFKVRDRPENLDRKYDWFDPLPHHFVMHMIGVVKILAYKAPNKEEWYPHFLGMCKALKMHPETEEEMDARLKDEE
jgi:hypothetical protein